MQAAREGAQLIVFPETFVPYYPYFSFVRPPVASGADHLRLYEEAVVVPGPVDAGGRRSARALHRHGGRARASTSAITAASTTRSSSSTPTAAGAQAPQDHAYVP